jgi:tetratricopeptide (TPR) repeat protein
VVALLAYLITIELTGERPQVQASGGATPPTMPNAATGSIPAPAIAQLEAAVQAAPNDAAALLRLANALHDNGMLPRAIDGYRKYLALRPQDPDARTDLGICYFQMSQMDSTSAPALLEQAAREMETSLKYSPRHQPSAFNLGVVNLHMGKIEESNTWFRKTVELNKDSDLGMRAPTMLTQHSFPQ